MMFFRFFLEISLNTRFFILSPPAILHTIAVSCAHLRRCSLIVPGKRVRPRDFDIYLLERVPREGVPREGEQTGAGERIFPSPRTHSQQILCVFYSYWCFCFCFCFCVCFCF